MTLADVLPRKRWTRGDRLRADELNGNFDTLAALVCDLRDFENIRPNQECTAGLQAAINQSAAAGAVLRSARATYLTSTSLILPSNLVWDAGFATIQLQPGANSDVFTSAGAYNLFGTNTYAGVSGVALRNLCGDGDMAHQTPSDPDRCNGLSYYGWKPHLENVKFRKIKGHGLRTEWAQYGEPDYGMEAHCYSVTVDTCGRHGWWNRGPHDTVTYSTHVIDAGQETDNTWCGYLGEGFASAKHFAFHGWHRSTVSNRVKHQAASYAATRWIGPDFEGGRSQYADFGGLDFLTQPNFYGHFGPAGSAMAIITGQTDMASPRFQAENTQDVFALQIGTSALAAGNWAVTNGRFFGFKLRSPFNFVGDNGYAALSGVGFSAAGGASAFAGTPSPNTRIVFRQGGTEIDIDTGAGRVKPRQFTKVQLAALDPYANQGEVVIVTDGPGFRRLAVAYNGNWLWPDVNSSVVPPS